MVLISLIFYFKVRVEKKKETFLGKDYYFFSLRNGLSLLSVSSYPFIHRYVDNAYAQRVEGDILDYAIWQSLFGTHSKERLSAPTRRDGMV